MEKRGSSFFGLGHAGRAEGAQCTAGEFVKTLLHRLRCNKKEKNGHY